MGCGASSEGADAAGAPTAKSGSTVAAKDTFVSDLLDLLFKLITDPDALETLTKEVEVEQAADSSEIEKLVKMLMSALQTVMNITPPRHSIGQFLIGCLVAFMHESSLLQYKPDQTVTLAEVHDAGYHMDAKWAAAVYDKDRVPAPTAALAASMAEEPNPKFISADDDIVFFRPTSELGRPAYAVALDRERSLVLLIVRGTANWKDVVSDAAGKSIEYLGGYAHESVAEGATAIFQECRTTILEQVASNPGFAVRCVGHSLGGGVAGCVTLLMHRDEEFVAAVYGGAAPDARRITASCFGSAAVLNRELTLELAEHCTTLVLDADVVPRLCTANLSDFIKRADAFADTFEAVSDAISKLLDGQEPAGFDDERVADLLIQIISDPSSVLKSLLTEKLDATEDKVEELIESDEQRLYAPGKVLMLLRPEGVVAQYEIRMGSIVSAASNLKLKASMFRDHGVVAYVHACCSGDHFVTAAAAAKVA